MAYAGRGKAAKNKKGSIIATKEQQESQGIMGYALALIIIAFSFHLLEWLARKDASLEADRFFADQNWYYVQHFFWGIPFILVSTLFATPKIKLIRGGFFEGGQILRQIIVGIGLVLAIQITIGFVLQPFFGTISVIEKVIFYFTGAITEEVWYRWFVQNTGAGLLRKIPVKILQKNYVVAGIIAMIPTSLYFMFAHQETYGGKPLLYFGTFLLGVAFGTVYLISNNIFIPFLCHGLNNLFTAFWKINTLSTGGEIPYFAFTVIVFLGIVSYAILFKAKDKRNEDKETDTGMIVPAEANKNMRYHPNLLWWLLGIVIALGLVFSFIIGAWNWYIPTAGSPP